MSLHPGLNFRLYIFQPCVSLLMAICPYSDICFSLFFQVFSAFIISLSVQDKKPQHQSMNIQVSSKLILDYGSLQYIVKLRSILTVDANIFKYMQYLSHRSVFAIRMQNVLKLVGDKGALLPPIMQEITHPFRDQLRFRTEKPL